MTSIITAMTTTTVTIDIMRFMSVTSFVSRQAPNGVLRWVKLWSPAEGGTSSELPIRDTCFLRGGCLDEEGEGFYKSYLD